MGGAWLGIERKPLGWGVVPGDPAAWVRGETLRVFVAGEIAAGAVTSCNAYEEVDRRNVRAVNATARESAYGVTAPTE